MIPPNVVPGPTPLRRRPRLPPGIRYRKDRAGNLIGLRVRVHIRTAAGSHTPSKVFRLDEFDEAEAWLKKTRQDHGVGAAKPVQGARGTLGPDVDAWLATQAAKPSHKNMVSHMKFFLQRFSRNRPTRGVTTEELNQMFTDWQLPPTAATPPAYIAGTSGRHSRGCDLKAGCIRRRRTTYKSFFDATVGKKHNPLNEAQRFKQPKLGVPRSVPYKTIDAILAAMPDYQSHKRGTAPTQLSLAKPRATILAYTGLAPKMLSDFLQAVARDPSRLQLRGKQPTMRMIARTKGDGVEERELPIAPQAVAAFQLLLDVPGGLARFRTGTVSVAIGRAAKRIGVKTAVTAYWLRHSFGTQVYRKNRDIGSTGRVLMHAQNSAMTFRYTLGAHAEVDRATIAAFAASTPKVTLATIPSLVTRAGDTPPTNSRVIKHLRAVR